MAMQPYYGSPHVLHGSSSYRVLIVSPFQTPPSDSQAYGGKSEVDEMHAFVPLVIQVIYGELYKRLFKSNFIVTKGQETTSSTIISHLLLDCDPDLLLFLRITFISFYMCRPRIFGGRCSVSTFADEASLPNGIFTMKYY